MKIFFPYESIRPEQEKLVKDVFTAVNSGKKMLVHAPTGLGKTVSSLTPAITVALEKKKKIFFLTPKISQHEIVLETVKLVNKKFGLGLKTVDLVGRKSFCLDPFISNTNYGFYDACSKKKKEGKCKYYNNSKGKTMKQKKIAQKKKAVILKTFNMSYAETKEQCYLKEMCPYEITLEKCKEADIIIADYSHIFDSGIRETILSVSKTSLSDIILIVDEAHNLSERIRDMFTSNISVSVLENAEKEAKSIGDFETQEKIKDINKKIISLGKNLGFNSNEALVSEKDLEEMAFLLKESLLNVEEAGLKFLARRKTDNCSLLVLLNFIELFLQRGEHTLQLIEKRSSLTLTITPLDVADFSEKVINNAYSAVLMSGTLLPVNMFADILGIKDFVGKEYSSPFPKENRLNLFVEKTTTKYTERNEKQFDDIADVINKTVPKIPGNTIVFFPSFEIMNQVSERIRVSRKILKQEREQSNDEKTNLIHNFRLLGSRFGGILLAVSGGSIAEGIDFPGEHLSGAIIVGIPFSKVNLQTNALIKYYDKKFKKGWDYAYNAPAINKAVQASGRVIRTETDKGVCVFLDKRFCEKRFEGFFPKDFVATKTSVPEKNVGEFF